MTVLISRKTRAELRFSRKALRTCEPPISQLIASALKDPSLISFAAGLVDEESLPIGEMGQLASGLFADEQNARSALQYGTTLGLPPLRELLLRHIERLEGKPARQMGFTADEILLTTGSQQALYLIADTLLDPGDIVITASPSYFVFTGALASLGARVIGVPMDEQGMCVDQIGPLLRELQAQGQLQRVKFIYCTSYYQNPTGLSLALSRREALLRLIRRYSTDHRILLLEDAAYRELRYTGAALPSIKSFDRRNEYTILTQTFSKPFSPGIKLGYTVMPPDLLEQVLRQKGNHDFGSPNVCQWLAYEALRTPTYRRHVKRLCAAYRNKRDILLKAMEREISQPGITWTRPDGGLYVWMTLPENISAGAGGKLFQECLAQGVLYVPGEYAFPPGRNVPTNHLRLCFGQVPATKIAEGVRRLARAISLAGSP